MNLKIYIAGPFFNEQERSSLMEMIEIVRSIFPKADLFIPMEHFIPNGEELPNEIWAKKVFDMDVEAIDSANMVVAMYTGHYSDSGTVWEIGYAKSKKKHIIGYIPEWAQTKDMSLMVINSIDNVIDARTRKLQSMDNLIKGFNQK